MGDPEDLFRKQYTGPFVQQWHDITAQMGLAPSATFATQSSTSWDRIRSGGGTVLMGFVVLAVLAVILQV